MQGCLGNNVLLLLSSSSHDGHPHGHDRRHEWPQPHAGAASSPLHAFNVPLHSPSSIPHRLQHCQVSRSRLPSTSPTHGEQRPRAGSLSSPCQVPHPVFLEFCIQWALAGLRLGHPLGPEPQPPTSEQLRETGTVGLQESQGIQHLLDWWSRGHPEISQGVLQIFFYFFFILTLVFFSSVAMQQAVAGVRSTTSLPRDAARLPSMKSNRLKNAPHDPLYLERNVMI